MIKFLFKTFIIVVLLLIIIPLIMLLFGEGALLYKIFDWSFPNMKEKQEWVMFGDKPASNISASVSDLTIEHNVIREGKHGMNLFSKQVFKNLEGSDCYTMIRFFDDKGNPLKRKSAKDEDGNFCIIGKVVPDCNDCENDQRVFVAYDQFDVPETGLAYFLCDIRLFILDCNGERVELAFSQSSRFHLSKP